MIRSIVFALLLSGSAVFAQQWTSHGPPGGAMNALAVAPSDRLVLYAASGTKIFATRDAGATWQEVAALEDIEVLTVDPLRPSTVYAGGRSGVHKSLDSGRSWQTLAVPAGEGTTSILIDPRNPNVVYAGNRCGPIFKQAQWHESAGVYKSTDGGASWRRSINGMSGFQLCVEELTLDPISPDTLYATPIYGDSGFARSDDGAATWSRAEGLLPGARVVVDPNNPAVRYGIVGSFIPSLLTSVDGGKSWSQIEPEGIEPGRIIFSRYAGLEIDSDVGRLFLATGTGAYRSGDGARRWAPLEGAGRERANAIAFDRSSATLTLATDWGLYRSGGFPWNDWQLVALPRNELPISHVVVDARAGRVYAARGTRLFRSDDSGRTWRVATPDIDPLGIITSLTVDAAGSVYAVAYLGSSGDRILKLSATATRWIEIGKPYAGSFSFITADPMTPDELYVGYVNVISHTRDGGATWESVRMPGDRGIYPSALTVDRRNTNVLYASASDGILRSTDRGRSWSVIADVRAAGPVEISPADTTFYVRASTIVGVPVIARSENGETWRVFPAPTPRLACLAIDPFKLNTLYIGGEGGVFVSVDGGATWSPMDAGMPMSARFVVSLALDVSTRTLHAGSVGHGVWEWPLAPRRRGARP